MEDKYLNKKAILSYEIRQKKEEGAKTEQLEKRIEDEIGKINSKKMEDFEFDETEISPERFHKLYELASSKSGDFTDNEPSDFQDIKIQSSLRGKTYPINFDELTDKLHGAWLGRSAGCMLGKPVEGWAGIEGQKRIEQYLKEASAFPLDNYFPPPEYPEKYELRHGSSGALRNNIDHVIRDDDIDYPILNLKLLEEFGKDFSPSEVVKMWLEFLPFRKTYTAERVAYKNFVGGIFPPKSSKYLNPYRDWIGAQIRGDVFGWVNPGKPEEAAKQAYRDAICTHRGNGIYGEMFVAAMLARAFSESSSNVEEILETGLKVVPSGSRFSEAMRNTIKWSKKYDKWDTTFKRVMDKYGSYHWIHTIPNAAIVVLALVHGEGKFEKSITTAVMCGQDTDCNGATVGSILGVLIGAKNLPDKWVEPLNNKVESIIAGDSINTITSLTERTEDLVSR